MAYTKTNWVNGQTPINATNLNKIENQLEANDNKTVKFADKYFSTTLNTNNGNGIGTGSVTLDISDLNATEIIDVSFNLSSGNVVWQLKSNLSNPASIEVYGYRLSGPSTATVGARARILYR